VSVTATTTILWLFQGNLSRASAQCIRDYKAHYCHCPPNTPDQSSAFNPYNYFNTDGLLTGRGLLSLHQQFTNWEPWPNMDFQQKWAN